MIKNVLTLLILGTTTAGLVAQENASPFYVGLSAGFSQADLRAYQGGKSNGHAFELGYDFTLADEIVGLRIYGTNTQWTGDYSEYLEVEQKLTSWGVGLEFSFNTPVQRLKPFVGAGYMWWNGERVTSSPYLGYLNARYVHGLPEAQARLQVMEAGPNHHGTGKLGLRFGVNYEVIKNLSVALSYNVFQWKNDQINNSPSDIRVSQQAVKGFNRVNPSWIGLTVKYHFDLSF